MMSYVFFTADRIFGDELFDSKQFGMDAIIAVGGDVRVAGMPCQNRKKEGRQYFALRRGVVALIAQRTIVNPPSIAR